jgi:hypothetical protein
MNGCSEPSAEVTEGMEAILAATNRSDSRE